MVVICRNVSLAHCTTPTIHDNADTIKESANLGTEMFVCVLTN
jgi:hypothetical protein